MSVIRIELDSKLLQRVMALAEVRDKGEAVNPALSFHLERQERGVCVKRAFERACEWGPLRTPSACTMRRSATGELLLTFPAAHKGTVCPRTAQRSGDTRRRRVGRQRLRAG
ncbi:type II toxin-antitoxin system VapB family antitoxin [Streptomyces sp. CNQ085]|uniref:type II toxin-antitoxin system VapB family antitoxin n=1 Tax=Streptomyces sp. CNQ085 TaxID=2886944 RepID=UPI0035B333A3|nr:type II toxin-antitoxin system VapB family antitoxin [Streptomyces sp. CNQ085]